MRKNVSTIHEMKDFTVTVCTISAGSRRDGMPSSSSASRKMSSQFLGNGKLWNFDLEKNGDLKLPKK